jgi:hypothetical protein
MTQRATQTRSGTSAPPAAPHPSWPVRLPIDPEADAGAVVSEPSALERAGPAAPETPAEPPEVEHLSRSESQRAARTERHIRRRLSIACALLVAGCLVITILIVELARTHPAGLPASASAPALLTSIQLSQPPSLSPTTRSLGTDGATAPEGGHP